MDTKICRLCNETLTIDRFPTRRVKNATYVRSECRRCFKQRAKDRGWINPTTEKKHEQTKRRKWSVQRANGERPAFFIFSDCRSSDTRKGKERGNDLTIEFIENLISNGCEYCGDKESKMTLDRIDNTLGHLQSNVKPACYRCNIMRGSMPYNAWVFFLDAVKTARLAGAFGDWGLKPFNKRAV
jgi:hypothetical protein